MQIILNGEERALPGPMTIADLLVFLKVDERKVVVERNRDILRREDFPRISLAEGDRLEILTLVSGG